MTKKFTFGVLTFNSESFVIETLESIKYQIINYGNDIYNYLVVSDDASRDNTVAVVERWIKKNKDYFEDCLFIKHEENQGTAYNYTELIENIHTDYFIKLDGDDIIASGNVYQRCFLNDDNECRIFMPFRFKEGGVYYSSDSYIYTPYYYGKTHTNKSSLHMLETIVPFMTPQIVLPRASFTKKCFDHIRKFSVFEDDTSIFYIFKTNHKMYMRFYLEPLVLYRVHNKSVSNGGPSVQQIKFLDDLHNYNKELLRNEHSVILKFYLITRLWDSFLMKHRFSADRCIHRKINGMIYKYISMQNRKNKFSNQIATIIEEIIVSENRHIEYIRSVAEEFSLIKE